MAGDLFIHTSCPIPIHSHRYIVRITSPAINVPIPSAIRPYTLRTYIVTYPLPIFWDALPKALINFLLPHNPSPLHLQTHHL